MTVDEEAAERELVYLIEGTDGPRQLLRRSEFLERIKPDGVPRADNT